MVILLLAVCPAAFGTSRYLFVTSSRNGLITHPLVYPTPLDTSKEFDGLLRRLFPKTRWTLPALCTDIPFSPSDVTHGISPITDSRTDSLMRR